MRGILRLLPPLGALVMTVLVLGQAAQAEAVFKVAQYTPELAVVNVMRTKHFTEVHIKLIREITPRFIEPESDIPVVCWYTKSPDAPYLLADGRRYSYLGGTNVAPCPRGRKYRKGDVMKLRFQPLAPNVRRFSFIDGAGGDKQVHVRPKVIAIYVNFLDIQLTD